MRWLLRAFVAALVLSTGLAWAGDFEEGLAAYGKQKFPVALQKFKRAASKGSAGAQFYLGVMHGLGEGVAPDPAAELGWYRLAAEQGLAVAQFNLGNAYSSGQAVAQDLAEAVRWYKLAAAQGDADGAAAGGSSPLQHQQQQQGDADVAGDGSLDVLKVCVGGSSERAGGRMQSCCSDRTCLLKTWAPTELILLIPACDCRPC